MDLVVKELVQVGFSEKEALVYLAALLCGPSSVQKISRHAGVNRATTYLLIEALIKKGLMSSFVKKGKRFFNPESPERILSLIRLQKHELEEQEKELTTALPKLLALFNTEGIKPQIRYAEGLEGIASLMKLFEETEGEFVEIVSIDEVEKVCSFFQYRRQHIDSLQQRGVSYRLLAVMKEPDFSKIPHISGGEVRLIPADKFPLYGDISVRGNTVFMYSFQEQMLGMVMTSVDFANSVRQLFNLAWEGSSGYLSEKR